MLCRKEEPVRSKLHLIQLTAADLRRVADGSEAIDDGARKGCWESGSGLQSRYRGRVVPEYTEQQFFLVVPEGAVISADVLGVTHFGHLAEVTGKSPALPRAGGRGYSAAASSLTGARNEVCPAIIAALEIENVHGNGVNRGGCQRHSRSRISCCQQVCGSGTVSIGRKSIILVCHAGTARIDPIPAPNSLHVKKPEALQEWHGTAAVQADDVLSQLGSGRPPCVAEPLVGVESVIAHVPVRPPVQAVRAGFQYQGQRTTALAAKRSIVQRCRNFEFLDGLRVRNGKVVEVRQIEVVHANAFHGHTVVRRALPVDADVYVRPACLAHVRRLGAGSR